MHIRLTLLSLICMNDKLGPQVVHNITLRHLFIILRHHRLHLHLLHINH
jgi:hypothetical protein